MGILFTVILPAAGHKGGLLLGLKGLYKLINYQILFIYFFILPKSHLIKIKIDFFFFFLGRKD